MIDCIESERELEKRSSYKRPITENEGKSKVVRDISCVENTRKKNWQSAPGVYTIYSQ